MSLKINELDKPENLLTDPDYLNKTIEQIKKNEVFIYRNFFDSKIIEKLIEYLVNVGRHSIPRYEPITTGAANGHVINRWDPRATVQACFHQFNFFPWNGDIFDIFEKTKFMYQIKNVLSGHNSNSYMTQLPVDGYTRRVAFQFYPSGIGGLQKHSDPVGEHQLVVPTMNLNRKGIDFLSGGAYVEIEGTKYFTDEVSGPGDVLFFNAQTAHGVEIIDEDTKPDWYSFKGRWMMLFALNSIDNSKPAIAKQLE